jgi:hypothetical protein
VLFRHADRLLADPEVAGQLGGSGRYWAARSLLELARFAEDNEDLEAAARYYQRVIQQGLPGKALAAANLQRLTAGPEAG